MKLALTFDAEHPDVAGSDPAGVELILAELARADVKATFFLQGRWASAFPGTARTIATAGHLIGSHSHYHADMRLLTMPGIASDLGRARDAIKEASGVDPFPYFRFPFSFGIADANAARAVMSAGYRHLYWDLDSQDWNGASAREMSKRVTKGARRKDEMIVLFHTWPAPTAEGTRRVLEWARNNDVEFVTVDSLKQDHSGFAKDVLAKAAKGPTVRDIA